MMTPATTTKLNVEIRWMVRNDVPGVLAAEHCCSPSWDEEQLRATLRQLGCIGMVAEVRSGDGYSILGHMVYQLGKHHLEILRFLVHPAYRRRGVGRAMLNKLRNKLSSHRRHSLAVNVHEADLGMHLFLRAQGFRAEEVLRDEEAYRFVWTVEE